jgi:polygalacturonase
MKKIFYIIGIVILAVPAALYTYEFFKKDIIALINKDIEETPSDAGTLTIANCVVPSPTSTLVVNVKTRGAVGDGVKDDTAAIQAAIDQVAGTGGTVLVPAGIYMINAVTSLHLGNKMTFEMDNATLQAITNNVGNYAILDITGVSNVNVVGGTLKGERVSHQGTTGEWGMGIQVMSSSNVVINGVTSNNAWGDGFYIGSSTDIGSGSSNITLCSVVANNNRRQGLSIVAANGVIVSNSIFTNTNGALPMCGIDVETNASTTVSNVQILSSIIQLNQGCGIEVGSSFSTPGSNMISKVLIKNNIVSYNSKVGGMGAGIMIDTNTSGHQIINNLVTQNFQDGIDLMSGVTNTLVSGNISSYNGTTLNTANGIGLLTYDKSTTNTITGNIAIGNTKANLLDLAGGNTLTANIIK